MASEKLPLWLERILIPTAWDVTMGEDQTVSAHWAKHYYDHGYGQDINEAMDLFHEDLLRTPGFESEYRSTIGPVALAAALPHPLSHDLIFPHLKAGQKNQAMVTRQTSDLGFGYGNVYGDIYDLGDELLEGYLPEVIKLDEVPSDISDLGFGYGQDLGKFTYDPATSAITGDRPEADIYIKGYDITPSSVTYTLTPEQMGIPLQKEKAMPSNGPLSVTSLDFGYGAGIHAFPSTTLAPRRARRSTRVSVGKNIPRVRTMSKLNKFMHEWRKEIRQIEGRLGGFYGTSRPTRRRKPLARHRHRVNSFTYRRGGKSVHSHRVKSYRRRR